MVDHVWQSGTTGTLTYTATANGQVWDTWITGNCTSSTTCNTIWQTWTSTNPMVTGGGWYDAAVRQATPEQEAEAQRAIEERRERDRQRQARAALATFKAQEWLRSLLTLEQWEDYQETDAFTLVVESGSRYRIKRGYAGNVYLVNDDGTVLEALCCHPEMEERDDTGRIIGTLPKEDAMVAQLLALQHDEEAFRRTANITTYRQRRPAPADAGTLQIAA